MWHVTVILFYGEYVDTKMSPYNVFLVLVCAASGYSIVSINFIFLKAVTENGVENNIAAAACM